MEYTWKELSDIIAENHSWCEVNVSDDLSLDAFCGFGVSCVANPSMPRFTPASVREELERALNVVGISDETEFDAEVHFVRKDVWNMYIDRSGDYAWEEEWGDASIPIIMISGLFEKEET